MTARFLYDSLSDIHRWYFDEKSYTAEAIAPPLVGFCRTWPTRSTTASNYLDHLTFKQIVDKWQLKMLQVSLSLDAFFGGSIG